MKEKLSAIVPAAGQGERLGKGPKALVALAGRPLLCWCLETLQSSPWVDELVVAAPPEQESRTRALAQAYPKVRAVVPGGPHRQQSVANALPALSPDAAWVMVHDGARPLLDSRLVEDVVLTARAVGAAVAAIPVVDTIKLAEPLGRRVARTVPREGLWLVQTPQVFRRDWFEEAHRAAGAEGWLVTDDSALVEKLGYPVELVRASRYNLK
ncbi:MAG TPA: 2-C-methyl-D-erythritol 4-phosphate cytidylyltransferase, partial [Firmicutes bacterium]|nr:2-C-methyl-D-erythritol 4-phosphate cytidylyltransferase [Bacillota bacterium]